MIARLAAVIVALSCVACSVASDPEPPSARSVESSTLPTPSPRPTFTIPADVEPSIDADPAEMLPFSGEPPLWSLTERKTNVIARGLYQLLEGHWQHYAPVRRRCEGIPRVRPPLTGEGRVGGSAEVETCLRPYLEELGVQERALDLFFDTGIVIWESIPVGPFWIGRGYDYDMFGSNGFPPDYLFTPAGILDMQRRSASGDWGPIARAREAAMGDADVVRIRRAYAGRMDTALRYIGFEAFGETMTFLPEVQRYASGWSMPFTWELRGCHACATPLRGVFAIDLTDAGLPVGARYVGLCSDPDYRPGPGDIPPSEDFGLPYCSAPTGSTAASV